ncbi:hypothetical protein BDZ89DRAFT_1069814, partial [Hymenopellis radicata]
TAVSWHPQLCFFPFLVASMFLATLSTFWTSARWSGFCGDSTRRCFLGQFRGCGDCDAS